MRNLSPLLGTSAASLVLCLCLDAFAQEPAAPPDEPAPAASEPASAPAEKLDAETTKTDTTAKKDEKFDVDIEGEKKDGAASQGPNADDAGAPGEEEDFGHGMQFGLRAGFVGGYRMVFRYDESPFCHVPDGAKSYKDQQKFCGFGGPFAIDLALSFAPFDAIEPFIWTRLGLSGEPETNTNPIFFLGVGARIYTMSDSAFKIFIEPALGMELEKGAGNPEYVVTKPYSELVSAPGGQNGVTKTPFEYKGDVVFRLVAGPQFDFARGVGAYVNAGVTLGVLRAIHASLEGQIGLQLRFP